MKAKNKYIQNCLFASLVFGSPFIIMYFIAFQDIIEALCIGIIGGLLFGAPLTLFNLFLSKKMNKIRFEIEKYQRILFDGVANHWDGNISSGGWLFLTEEYLFFKAHKFNYSTRDIKILCEDIKQVSRSFKINSIKILCKDGHIEAFVVNERKKWISKLNEQINGEGNLKNCNGDIV